MNKPVETEELMKSQKLREAETKIANQRAEIIQLQEALEYARMGQKRPRSSKPTAECEAVRQAGYMALPRWWVTKDQFEVIERMAKGNRDEVYRIKHEVKGDAW